MKITALAIVHWSNEERHSLSSGGCTGRHTIDERDVRLTAENT